MEGDPPGIQQPAAHHVLDLRAVKVGALDLVRAPVGPVRLSAGGIQHDPLGIHQPRRHQILDVAAIERRPLDLVGAAIGPIDPATPPLPVAVPGQRFTSRRWPTLTIVTAAWRTLPTTSAGVSDARLVAVAARTGGRGDGRFVLDGWLGRGAGTVRGRLAVAERHRVTGGERPTQPHPVGHDVTSEGSRRAAASAPACRSLAGRSSSARRRSRGTSSTRSGSTSGIPGASRPSCWPPPGGRASR